MLSSTEHVIIHRPEMPWTVLPSTLEEGKAALLPAHDWASANCPTESSIMYSDNRDLMKAIQSGTPDTQHICQRLDNRRGSSGFSAPKAYQATRPLARLRKRLEPPPTPLNEPSCSPPRKLSSDALSTRLHSTGSERLCCTKTSPRGQTTKPPQTGQTPFS